MIQIAGDLDFPGWSGIVQSLQNSLTLQGSPSGDVIIGNTNDILPAQTLIQNIGSTNLRWLNSFVSSGNFQTLTIDGVPVSGDPQYVRTIYVAKHGNDSNLGTNPNFPLLTFGAAQLKASSLGPNASNQVVIYCVDAGLYSESFDVPGYVKVFAPLANISGTINVGDNSTVSLHQLTVVAPGIDTYGIARRPTANTTVSASGVSKVDINTMVLFTESSAFAVGLVSSSGLLDANVGTVLSTSGSVSWTLNLGSTSYRGNDVILNQTSSSLGRAFASIFETRPRFDGIVNRVIGTQGSTCIDSVTSTNVSGFIIANEVNVGLIYNLFGVSSGDLRVFANRIQGGKQTFSVTETNICVRDLCELDNLIALNTPVDARAVSGNIIPSTDDSFVLGSNSKRFKSVNTVLAKMSGLVAQEDSNISVSGHLIPFDDQKYSLGLANKKWAIINAQSGNFDATLTADGDISSGGNIGGVSVSATVGVFTTLAATLSLFTNRPELLPTGGFGTGSGTAAVNEIRHYDRLGVNSTAATQSLLPLSAGPSDTTTDPCVLTEDFLLRPSFGVSTRKNGAGAGTWVAVLRKFPAAGGAASNVASGFFTWAAASATRQTTIGLWSPTSVTFAQGDAYGIVTHNDGSGVTVSSGKIDFTIGWQVNHPNLGRGA